jgi:hypothetical protein
LDVKYYYFVETTLMPPITTFFIQPYLLCLHEGKDGRGAFESFSDLRSEVESISKESTVLATENPQNGAEIQQLFPSLPSLGETTGVLIVML